MDSTQTNPSNIQLALHYALATMQPHAGTSWWAFVAAGGIGIATAPSMRQLLRESIRTARQITLCWLLGRRKDLSAKQYAEIVRLIFKGK